MTFEVLFAIFGGSKARSQKNKTKCHMGENCTCSNPPKFVVFIDGLRARSDLQKCGVGSPHDGGEGDVL